MKITYFDDEDCEHIVKPTKQTKLKSLKNEETKIFKHNVKNRNKKLKGEAEIKKFGINL